MKKWQLLKIQKFIDLKKLRYTNYNDLLDFTDEQINIIINNIDKETTPNLIEFFSLLNRGKYDFTQFERIGITNIKEIIINKILYATDNKQSILILNWFIYKIDKFQTKEEWLTFMNNLTSEISISNLSYVIDTFENKRIETIEKVMKNAASLRTLYLSDVNKEERLTEANLLDLLDLVIMKYDVKLSSKLIKQLVNGYSTQGTMYDEVLKYLKKPVVFHNDLPKLFLDITEDESIHIIEMLQRIDNQALLDKYLKFDFKDEMRKSLDNYIYRIIEKENVKLRDSMILLLSDKENFERLIDELVPIEEKLETVNKEDDRCLFMTKLLVNIPYDIWVKFPIDIDLEKLEYICQNSKTFLAIINIVDEDIVIKSLNSLSLTELTKIFALVNLKAFINKFKMADELYLLFNSENAIIIDNAYKKYLLEEEKNKLLAQKNITRLDSNCDLELRKLSNILDNGYDINLVLDEYADDDELTSKTLIKTMK